MTVALLNTDMIPPLSAMKSTKKSESCIYGCFIMIAVLYKFIRLAGAVTDLENRHSMRLKGFLDLLDETALDIFKGLVFILIQGNGQNLLDIGNIQFYLYFFQIHFKNFFACDVTFLQKDI